MTAKEKIAMYLATIIAKKCDIKSQEVKWSPGLGMITKAHEDYDKLPHELIIQERKELILYLTGYLLSKHPELTHAVILEFNEVDKTIQIRDSMDYCDYPDLQEGISADGSQLFHFYKRFGEDLETIYALGYHLIILVV